MTVEVHPAAYRMALPDCWTRLPMEPTAMRTAARAYLLRRYARYPRDETFPLRRQLEAELVELTRRDGAEYARWLLALGLEVAGRPVAASCLVSAVPLDLSAPGALEDLVTSEADGAVDAAVVELGTRTVAVVVRDETTRAPRPQDPERVATSARRVAVQLGVLDAQAAQEPDVVAESLRFEADTRSVTVWVPVPDTAGTVLLQFSTPVPPLFDLLTELFLVTAGTLQLRGEDGRWH